jgi:hypothetical protein
MNGPDTVARDIELSEARAWEECVQACAASCLAIRSTLR